ncbi:sensor histidine kinase [Brevibacillus reuszeri]|uniref:sensor histidine kinase n=1 Tax=Brevibacillus reuszeri TaxID=54915 RepID=UPI000CCC49DA|nr:ATP-binding protein [Brevibacillus reuszeri]
MEVLLNYFVLDLPEAMLLLTIGYAVFNLPLCREWRRLVLCGVLFAIWGDVLTAFGVDYELKLFLFYSFEFLLFLSLGHRYKAFAMVVASSTWMMVSETTISAVMSVLGVRVSVFAESTFLRYALSFTYLSTLCILSFTLYKLRFNLRKLWPRTAPNRYLVFLIVSGGITFTSILLVNVSTFMGKVLLEELHPVTNYLWIYQLAALVLALITSIFFVLYVRATVVRVEKETEAPYSKQLIDLTTAVRAIKHDALSHFTVILGFLKMKEYQRIESFVLNLVDETKELIDITEGIRNKTIAAMLYGKVTNFAKGGVDFQVKVAPNSPQLESWKDIDISKLLGNLLDNAYTATLKMEDDDRYIRMEWGIRNGSEYLSIENSGPTIPDEVLPKLFDLGYTTRDSGDGGVGLAVVKGLVTKYKGEIDVISRHGVTRFTIMLPMAIKGSQEVTEEHTV